VIVVGLICKSNPVIPISVYSHLKL